MRKKKFFSKINIYDLLVSNSMNRIEFPGIEVVEACKRTRVKIFGDSSYNHYSSALSKLIWIYPLLSNKQWLNIYRMLSSWDGEMEALGVITINKIYGKYTRRHRRTLGRFRFRTCDGILRENRRKNPAYTRQEKKITIQRLVSKNKQINREM